jgi:hypothetical protein
MKRKIAAWDGFLTAQQTAGNSVRSLSSIRLYKDHFICQRARYIFKIAPRSLIAVSAESSFHFSNEK